MTTRKLKVWCEECLGDGTGPVSIFSKCSECKGDGFTLREVVELPDGRAVVVPAGYVESRARQQYEEAHEHCESTSGDWDGEPEQTRTLFRASVTLDIRALFTGKVYEAEAVGPAVVVGICAIECRAETVQRGDLIAVGLKEVGRG